MKTKLLLILVTLIMLVLPISQVAAITPEQQHEIDNGGTVYYQGDQPLCSVAAAGTVDSTSSPSQIQIQNAQIIIGVAKSDNLGQQGALIGLMVGLDESGLKNLANENVPLSEQNTTKQGDGDNGTSLGVFQQQILDNWSTISSNLNDVNAIAQLMTPAYAAEAFFGSPPGANVPSALSKGLQNIANWQTLAPQVAAQDVQQSGTPSGSNYAAEQPQAQSLLNQYYDSSSAVVLAVAITGGSSTTGGATTASCGVGATLISGTEQQLAEQIITDPNITYDYGPNGIVAQPFKDLANGQQADTAPNSGTTNVSTVLLGYILAIAQSHKVNISSLTTQHTPGDVHSVGDAVDINYLDGAHLSGRDPGSLTIIGIGETVLPSGSGFGQSECGPPLTLPAGFIQFADTCNHLHTQVPIGTP